MAVPPFRPGHLRRLRCPAHRKSAFSAASSPAANS